MTKEEKLDFLLNESQIIREEQQRIFSKNNIPNLHLHSLPVKERKKWERLQKIQRKIHRQMLIVFK